MTDFNILELAKQGNVEAIATLINNQLQAKGIIAKVALKNACLQVIVESSEVPEQQAMVTFIRKGITGLKPVSIEKVKVYGRQIGEEFPAWSNEFELVMQTNSTKNLENLEVNKKEFYEVIGSNGQIRLTRNRIIISRKGAMGFISQGLKGDKEIPISRITAIQFKHNDALTKGYLQFSIQGGLESRGGVFAATTDENTVMFTDLQEPSFKELKRYIDSVMDNEPINFDTLNFVEINATYQQNKEKIIETKQKMIESNAQSNKVLANKVFKPLLAIVIVSSIIMSISPEESASKILFGLAFIISSTCLMFSLPYIYRLQKIIY